MFRPARDRDMSGWLATRPTDIGSQGAGNSPASGIGIISRASTGIATGTVAGTVTATGIGVATGIMTGIGTMTASDGSSQPITSSQRPLLVGEAVLYALPAPFLTRLHRSPCIFSLRWTILSAKTAT